jgi:hypothetical protein
MTVLHIGLNKGGARNALARAVEGPVTARVHPTVYLYSAVT